MNNLEPFFESVGSTNPFVDNRVSGLSADAVDVADIHAAAFERLTGLARQACELRRGLGAVLWGEAGIGKSHLLARLAGWAEGKRQAWAVYLHNLQASPENLPRSILKLVVSVLTRGQARSFAQTPLFDLVFGLVKEAVHYDLSMPYPWPAIARAYSGLLDRLSAEDFARAAPVDRTVFAVLFRFFRSAMRAAKTGDEREAALAVRWLSGDCLDAGQARQLQLPAGSNPGLPAALADNQQIKQVLVALSRMALSCDLPLLLCFDQVDNLDDEQAAALSRFLEALIDSSPNLLVVTAGIQATLFRWHETKVIQDSAWDRLAQFKIDLHRLSPEASRHIIAARLRKAVTPFADLESLRLLLHQDDLFPLGRTWAEEFFRDRIDLRPRDVINGAREAWLREQEMLARIGGSAWLEHWPSRPGNGGKDPPPEVTEEQIRSAIDRKVVEKISQFCEQWRQAPDTLMPDADHLAGLVATLLRQVGSVDITRPPSGHPDKEFPFNIVVQRFLGEDGKVASTGLRFLVTDNAHSTTAALRWLTEAAAAPDGMLLVTEARCPLAFGSQSNARGREYYAELKGSETRRFEHIELSFEDHAQLAALREVIGLVRSGDLEIELPGSGTRKVETHEAIESLQRQDLFLESTLLGKVLTDAVAAPHPVM